MALKEDILNIIGLDTTSDYLDSSSIADIYPIMSDAVYRAVCSLPKKLLLLNCAVSVDPENLPDNTTDPSGGNDPFAESAIPDDGYALNDGAIILALARTKSSSKDFAGTWTEVYQTRYAKEVVSTEKIRSLDPDSIHYATDYSPVYWVENVSNHENSTTTIHTAPPTVASKHTIGDNNYLNTDSSGFKVWYYPYQIISDSDDKFNYTPDFIKEFLLKVCAIALINTKIAAQATEEEDSELIQLLGNVKAVFEEDVKNQLLNYQEKY